MAVSFPRVVSRLFQFQNVVVSSLALAIFPEIGGKHPDLAFCVDDDRVSTFAFGTAIPPSQRPGVPGTAGPVREVHLGVTLTWLDEAVVFTNTNSAIESGGGWRSAANDIAKQIDKWIVDHRAQILRVP